MNIPVSEAAEALGRSARFQPGMTYLCLVTDDVTLAPDLIADAQQEERMAALRALDQYVPRTELGKRLVAARRAYIESGGRLLSADEVRQELARGGGHGSDR